MKKIVNSNGYATCVHSWKKKNAPWKVHDSCPSENKLPGAKDYELPYPSICMECGFYRKDSVAETRKKGTQ